MLDANLAAGQLESAGIDCYIQDQYLIQAKPELANVYGGIKLQIREEDAEKAIQTLKVYGYFNEENEKPLNFIDALDKLTARIPLLSKSPLQVRLLAIIFLTLALVLITFILKHPVENIKN